MHRLRFRTPLTSFNLSSYMKYLCAVLQWEGARAPTGEKLSFLRSPTIPGREQLRRAPDPNRGAYAMGAAGFP